VAEPSFKQLIAKAGVCLLFCSGNSYAAAREAMSDFKARWPILPGQKPPILQNTCLLYPQKWTCAAQLAMSALGQKQTSLQSSRPFPENAIEIVQADEPLANSIAFLIDASSLICFVPTFAFEFLVFLGCWIVGRPLTNWRRYRLHTMSCFVRYRPFFRFCHGST